MTAPAPTRIVLPPLHPGQKKIAEDPARFQVVVCGRRWGKTTYGILKCVKGALTSPGIYWWVGPSYPTIAASGAWPTLKKLIQPIDGVEIREADRQVMFPNGSEIWVKTADNPDTLRGPKLSGAVLDEFAQIKEEAWYEVIRPALADMRGWALFIGTPKGKNWAYKLFEKAKVTNDWTAFQEPTRNNPYIPADEIEAAREDMSEERFAQEFEADFGASQYLVYPEIVPEIHRWKGPVPEFVSYHGGMDFGGDSIGAHSSVTVIGGRTAADDIILFACFKQSGPNIAERQLNWTFEQEEKIRSLRRINKQYPAKSPVYLADKSQTVGIQFMRKYGLNVRATKGGPDSVLEGIEMMHRRLKVRTDPITGTKRPKLFWLKDTPFVEDDLMSYRYAEPVEGKEARKNPLKINDDLADAVRYMIEGIDRIPYGDPYELYAKNLPRLR